MIRVRLQARPLVVLDVDIENRPLAYLGGDFTTGEITAIAASFCGESLMFCWLLGRDDPREMLIGFSELYDLADIVTGHYLLKHDLPVLNGAMLEYGLPPLAPKWVSDTKIHLPSTKHISMSQESLSYMLRIEHEKQHMSNPEWRAANRLTPEGLALTEQRVTKDVMQHKALRTELLRLGALKPPTLWEG